MLMLNVKSKILVSCQ